MVRNEIFNAFFARKQTILTPSARVDPRGKIWDGSDHLDEVSLALGQMGNALENEDAKIRSPVVRKQRCEN